MLTCLLACACGGSAPDSATKPTLGEPFAPGLLEHRVGIAACDGYVDSVNRCLVARLPEDEQTPRLAATKQHLGSWLVRKGAAPEDAKELRAIEDECTRVADAERAELRTQGCVQ